MMKSRYRRGILATCCIPWNADGGFAEEVFRRQVRHTLAELTRDVYIFGTAGEGYAVTDVQFDEICRVFREECKRPGVRAMVGVIGLAQAQMLERIGRARNLGFRYFQISLPSWGALTELETRRFFRDVCGRFPDCGFLHYNLMRAKRLVSPDEYAVLARENPNLVATKNSTADMERILGLLTRAPELTHFITESGFAYGALAGRCGLLISVSSTNFALGRAYYQAGQRRQLRRLLTMQADLAALVRDLISLVSPEAHMDGAYDKVFCRLHDPEFPLRLLPPYAGLSEDAYQKIVAMMRRKYPQWLPEKSG